MIRCTLFSKSIYSGRYFSLSFFIRWARTAPKQPLLDAASTHKYFVASSLIKLHKKGFLNPPTPETFFASDFHNFFKCCSFEALEKRLKEEKKFVLTGSMFF